MVFAGRRVPDRPGATGEHEDPGWRHMESEGSVTRLIGMLKEGDRTAAQQLWETYFRRLVGLARARLRNATSTIADEEDVALSAFDSFYRRAERGQFPRLQDRDDLWQLLFVLTVRKAINLVSYQGCKSRGGGGCETSPTSRVSTSRHSSALSPAPSSRRR